MKIITQYDMKFNAESGIWEIIYTDREIETLFETTKISKYGKVVRHFISEDGERKKVLIQVVIDNTDNGTTHRLIPDFLIPYRLHCTDTIEKIVIADGKGFDVTKIDVACDGATIKRILKWRQAVLVCFQGVKESIKAKLAVDISAVEKLCQIVRVITNNNFWFSIQSAYKSD